MTPERAADIERICHAVLERDVSARARFLDVACAGDTWVYAATPDSSSSVNRRMLP